MLDPITELKGSLDVLSRAEIERAWSAAETVSKALDGNMPMRAEAASYLLAHILAELGASSADPDLADVLPAVEGLAMYAIGRMTTIAVDLGKTADAA